MPPKKNIDTSRAGSTSGKGVKRKGDDEEYSSDTTVTSSKTADICDDNSSDDASLGHGHDQSSEDDSVDSAVFNRDSPLSPSCSKCDMSENESESAVDPELFNRDSPISPMGSDISVDEI